MFVFIMVEISKVLLIYFLLYFLAVGRVDRVLSWSD